MEVKTESELEIYFNRQRILMRIIEVLKNNPLSITALGKKINVNRSTLRHYLRILKEQDKIIFERQMKLPGRPTLIKLNRKSFDKDIKDMKEIAEEWNKKQTKSPYTNKILLEIKKKKIGLNDIFELTKNISNSQSPSSDTFSSIEWLKLHQYIKEFYEITQEGEKFLIDNENKKQTN